MEEERKMELVQTEDGFVFMPVKSKKKKESKIASFFSKIFQGRKKQRETKQRIRKIELHQQNPSILEYARKVRSDKEELEELKKKYYQLANKRNKKGVAKLKKEILELNSSIQLGIEYLRIEIKKIQASNMDANEKGQLLDEVYGVAGIEPLAAHMKNDNPKTPKHMKEVEIIEETDERQTIEAAKHFAEGVKNEILSQLDETEEKSQTEQKGISK